MTKKKQEKKQVNIQINDNQKNKSAVKRAIIELSRYHGSVIPINEIILANPEILPEDVVSTLDSLKDEGIITIIDKETIQVNI